jgi:hypothetical protein
MAGRWSPSLAGDRQDGTVLTDPIESLCAVDKSSYGVGIAQCRQFVAERGTDAKAESLGFVRRIGIFGNDTVDDAVCE